MDFPTTSSGTKYTMLFHDYLDLDKEWFNKNIVLSTNERTERLHNSLISMFGVYEISAETIGLFRIYLLDTLNLYKAYYEEMLDSYDKKYDFTEGVETKVSSEEEAIHVELPNKKISKDTIFDYPNDASKNSSSMITTSKDKFISLKNQYMRHIRDLFNEFASRFYDCFIHIY